MCVSFAASHFLFGSVRADPCTLGKDRSYRESTVGERATSFLHPKPFGQSLHQWQRILVQLVLLLRGARASVGCRKAERSSSTRTSRSHKGRIGSTSTPVCDLALPIMALLRHTFRFSTSSINALSYHGLPHQASASRNVLGAKFHRAFVSNAAYESSISIKFNSISPNIARFSQHVTSLQFAVHTSGFLKPGRAGDSNFLNLMSWRLCGEPCGTMVTDDADENENLESVDASLEPMLC